VTKHHGEYSQCARDLDGLEHVCLYQPASWRDRIG
jgi:hypothetical protein